ncbi:hypothetical protein HAALTHF_44410n [Vreelandella aquamarina]|nr:hypothetical protein HAALTHF_44410n [Halomonas axialensis]
MPSYQAPLRDIRFVMDEMFDYPSHYAALPNGEDASPDVVSAILERVVALLVRCCYLSIKAVMRRVVCWKGAR